MSVNLHGLTERELKKFCRDAGLAVKGADYFFWHIGLMCTRLGCKRSFPCVIAYVVPVSAAGCSIRDSDQRCNRGPYAAHKKVHQSQASSLNSLDCVKLSSNTVLACHGCAVDGQELLKGELVQILHSWLFPVRNEEGTMRLAEEDMNAWSVPMLQRWLRHCLQPHIPLMGARRTSCKYLLSLQERCAWASNSLARAHINR